MVAEGKLRDTTSSLLDVPVDGNYAVAVGDDDDDDKDEHHSMNGMCSSWRTLTVSSYWRPCGSRVFQDYVEST